MFSKGYDSTKRLQLTCSPGIFQSLIDRGALELSPLIYLIIITRCACNCPLIPGGAADNELLCRPLQQDALKSVPDVLPRADSGAGRLRIVYD